MQSGGREEGGKSGWVTLRGLEGQCPGLGGGGTDRPGAVGAAMWPLGDLSRVLGHSLCLSGPGLGPKGPQGWECEKLIKASI